MLLLSKLVGGLILPPAGPLLLAALGLVLSRRWRRLGLTVVAFAIVFLAALSLPVVATALHAALQKYPALSVRPAALENAGAIVILGGGRHEKAPEYGGDDTVSAATLVRLRYGAHLHRATRLPVLVSGGVLYPGDEVPEAELMIKVMEEEFSVPVRWRETRSRNTAENARLCADTLLAEGIRHVVLVTHSTHMRRSVDAFVKAGFDVTPAPTAILVRNRARQLEPRDLVPQAWALEESRSALHELLGLAWYSLRY